MRKIVIFVIAAVFLLALLARLSTYTVRFTESAVLTTFGSAGSDSRQTEPGLKFKWPDPIQSVTKYDTRTRFLQTRSETQQTADSRQLVVETFLTWRVADPLEFFKRFSSSGAAASEHYRRAEDLLRGSLRAAMGEISKYRMRDLFTTDPAGSKLTELEDRVKAALLKSDADGGGPASWGIEVTGVGINRIVLPEETSKEVVNSMKADRERLIRDLETRGQSQEQAIVSKAEADARRIENFARELAAELRQRGDVEGAQFVEKMNAEPRLAVFLKNMEFVRDVMAKRITFIFNTGVPGFGVMSPVAPAQAATGVVPGVDALMQDDPTQRLLPAANPQGQPQGQPAAPARPQGDAGDAAPRPAATTTAGGRP